MADDQEISEIDYEEQYRLLSDEHKKLSIDIASLQLSNRSLVNQNRDEKKKVMDCRLQISDLESRLKTLDNIKHELTESQTQAERLRQSLDANENKLSATERRASEAEGLVKVKDSIIEKQRKFSKELEEKVQHLSDELEGLSSKCGKLEVNLSEALDRADECDRLREIVIAKTALLDKLAESSDGVTNDGLAAANAFFKDQEFKLSEQLAEVKQVKTQIENDLKSISFEKDLLQKKVEQQDVELENLTIKCANLEASVKESKNYEKRTKNDMSNARLIGPSLPPWILEEKKPDPNELEKLNNADPATLRNRVLDLEGKVHELNQLLTYREDVILRIYQEIQKKASRLEAAEVDRSSLAAQVGILKRELDGYRDEGGFRGGRHGDNYAPEIEIEIERLRGKRDREYQRRKRAEAEMDEMEVELNEVKEKMKKLEEEMAALPKPVVHTSDPADKSRITELQSAVNQLRMDNEAKRSELFDLRARFDEKSALLDSFSSEMKSKERQVSDLSAELSMKTSQLEQANKELEAVRLRVVRGGVETERWQTDLNSVRTTNRFLAQQSNELRLRLSCTEAQLANAQKRLIALKKGDAAEEGDVPLCNGLTEVDKVAVKEREIVDLKSKLEITELELSAAKLDSANLQSARQEIENLKSKCDSLSLELKSEKQCSNNLQALPFDDHKIRHMVSILKDQDQATEICAEHCVAITEQLIDLKSVLNSVMERFLETTNENRLVDPEPVELAQTDIAPSPPPAKRARRTRSSITSPSTRSECLSCVEFRRQVQTLESDLADAITKNGTLVTELNELQSQLNKAIEMTSNVRGELGDIRKDLVKILMELHQEIKDCFFDTSLSPLQVDEVKHRILPEV